MNSVSRRAQNVSRHTLIPLLIFPCSLTCAHIFPFPITRVHVSKTGTRGKVPLLCACATLSHERASLFTRISISAVRNPSKSAAINHAEVSKGMKWHLVRARVSTTQPVRPCAKEQQAAATHTLIDKRSQAPHRATTNHPPILLSHPIFRSPPVSFALSRRIIMIGGKRE